MNVSYRIVHSSEYKVTVMPVTKLRQTGRSRRTRPRRAAAVTGTVGPTPVRGGAAEVPDPLAGLQISSLKLICPLLRSFDRAVIMAW